MLSNPIHSAPTAHTDEWLAGYEAAKTQAATALEGAAAYALDETKRDLRLRSARMIRGMLPKGAQGEAV